MFTIIRAKIVSELTAKVGSGGTNVVKSIANFNSKHHDVYPAVNVIAGNLESDVADQKRNQRIYTFIIKVIQPIDTKVSTYEDAETAFLLAIDDIVSLMDDRFLDDTLDFLEPIQLETGTSDDEATGDARVGIISFKARMLENIA